MNPIIVKGLNFYYSKNEPVLKDIHLEFDQRSTAIIGQNGAGKTTFVKLLKGLLKPVSGQMTYGSLDITQMTAAKLAPHIGLVFQNPNDQIFKNSVIDEVMFGPLSIGKTVDEAHELAVESLKMVGLLQQAEHNPYDLSLSERKLISIASILAMDTPVVIFDEPTIAQDYAGKEKIKEIIKQLKGQGKLVMTIIHDMDFVAENFERTIVFSKGQVVLDGDTKTVFSKAEVLSQNYLEPPHVTQIGNALGSNETYLTVEHLVKSMKSVT